MSLFWNWFRVGRNSIPFAVSLVALWEHCILVCQVFCGGNTGLCVNSVKWLPFLVSSHSSAPIWRGLTGGSVLAVAFFHLSNTVRSVKMKERRQVKGATCWPATQPSIWFRFIFVTLSVLSWPENTWSCPPLEFLMQNSLLPSMYLSVWCLVLWMVVCVWW